MYRYTGFILGRTSMTANKVLGIIACEQAHEMCSWHKLPPRTKMSSQLYIKLLYSTNYHYWVCSSSLVKDIVVLEKVHQWASRFALKQKQEQILCEDCNLLTLSHQEAVPWRVKSYSVRQSKLTKGIVLASLGEKGLNPLTCNIVWC